MAFIDKETVELRLPLYEQVKLRAERLAERDFKNGKYGGRSLSRLEYPGGAWDKWYKERYRELLLERLSDIES